MNVVAPSSPQSVGAEPSLKLHRWLGIATPDATTVGRRVALAILIVWVPLAVLSALTEGGLRAFIADFAVHFKYLIALPVLILADAVSAPRLSAIVSNFLDAGLVTADDRPRFDAAVSSMTRLRNSAAVDIGVILLAYVVAAWLFYASGSAVAGWRALDTGGRLSLSPAGWWLLLVSLPLLLTLILSWLWRWFLWARFLWFMSRLDLQLVPSHPDRAGGLRFTAYSISASVPFGIALGALTAGDVANAVVHQGAPLLGYRYHVVEIVAVSVMFFTAPLLVFFRQLLSAWRRGVFEYAALADRFGHQFERRWFGRDRRPTRACWSGRISQRPPICIRWSIACTPCD